jgi:hypothetical protein
VARILVCDPNLDVSALLAFAVRRIGHEPVLPDGTPEQPRTVDAIVLEPACPLSLELAGWARAHAPRVAIVCASIYPPWAEAQALAPHAYLLKPFPLVQLEQALTGALGRPVVA